jgi:glutathione peroxidase
MMGKPKWNFHKYLIGRDGQIIDWFASTTSPDGEKIRDAVNMALAQNNPS